MRWDGFKITGTRDQGSGSRADTFPRSHVLTFSHSHPAFSLAEMMIALVILGFGLIVVGAALPVGFNYTRQSVDLVNGEVAVEAALDAIEARLSMRRVETLNDTPYPRIDPIFRPRELEPPPPSISQRAVPRVWWEPRIKVRPLFSDVLDFDVQAPADLATGYLTPRRWNMYSPVYAMTEGLVGLWLATQPFNATPGDMAGFSLEGDDRRVLPSLPMNLMVYPAVPPSLPVQQAGISPGGQASVIPVFTTSIWRQASWNPASTNAQSVNLVLGDFAKMKERRIGFAVFYRRVDYGNPGPNNYPGTMATIGPGDDDPGNPGLYEVIVVAMRRPTERHRFPIFQMNQLAGNPFASASFSLPFMAGQTYQSSVIPIPILAKFEISTGNGLMAPNVCESWYQNNSYIPGINRVLGPSPNPPPPETVTFRASNFVGSMLLPGSVIIPAANDDYPDSINPVPTTVPLGGYIPVRGAGFVPHSPTELPIYRVRQRTVDPSSPGSAPSYLIEIECNGFYPWVFDKGPSGVRDFPVWIIPPAFQDIDRNTRQPVYEDAGVLSVGRRFVRIPELSY